MTPYTPPQSDGLGQQISRAFVATLVPVFGLFGLRLVLGSLPMIKNAGALGSTGLTPLVLMNAAIDTLIYFLIVKFALDASQRLRSARPHLVQVATVTQLAGWALVAILAYTGYETLFAILLPGQMELYNWIFLALVLAPVAMIVIIVTRNMDTFTSRLFGKITEATSAPPVAAHAVAMGAAPPPPPGPAPSLDAGRELRSRLTTLRQQLHAANSAAERLRARGEWNAELAESASKMGGYLDGAAQCVESGDWSGAKHFADWAEYESGRILAVAK